MIATLNVRYNSDMNHLSLDFVGNFIITRSFLNLLWVCLYFLFHIKTVLGICIMNLSILLFKYFRLFFMVLHYNIFNFYRVGYNFFFGNYFVIFYLLFFSLLNVFFFPLKNSIWFYLFLLESLLFFLMLPLAIICSFVNFLS